MSPDLFISNLVVVIATFVSVFAKGFQHKNVQHMHYRLTAVTSYIIAMLDVVTVNLIVKNGWLIAFGAGTGAALGMVSAMWFHAKFINKPD